MKQTRFLLSTLLGLMLVIMGGMPCLAAAPNLVNYQGVLADASGVPLPDQDVLMSFRVYDVESGGLPLWQETHATVRIENGKFNVVLGSGSTNFGSFDPSLFSAGNRWLEIGVQAETMEPRLRIQSSAYSLVATEADNATTVGGFYANQLDQSSHVAAVNNPHNVQADQLGIDVTGLDSAISHVGSTSNPHGVTPGQIGAATPSTVSTSISNHAANASAHHVKYTDAEAMNAILSNDGAGSSLDADKLDGLEASDIIAAQSAGAPSYQFIGFSTQNRKPFANVGFYGMNDACENAFPGMGSRMCTSEEIVKTPIFPHGDPRPTYTTIEGWVNPTVVAGSSAGFLDASGIILTNGVNCDAWQNGTYGPTALTYEVVYSSSTTPPQINFKTDVDCGSVITKVTCCAPAP